MICAPGPDGRFVGFTANSFNSVSLDPPLVVWSLNRRASNLAAFEHAGRYAINVLAHDQADLARRFSRPHADRFAGVGYRLGAAGAPLIDGCVAWFECRHHAQHRAGDHVLFIGEVETCARRKGSRTRLPPRPLRDHAAARVREVMGSGYLSRATSTPIGRGGRIKQPDPVADVT